MPYAQNGRVRIYWEEEGAGDPLLLIMGLSFSLSMWGALWPFLARNYRTIAFDNRCIGKSDFAALPFSIADMAEDALAVLKAANVSRAHVFGLSMGGMIAQELAARHPDCVHKLILGCTHCAGRKALFPDWDAVLPVAFPFITREARMRKLVPLIFDAHTPRELVDQDLERVRQSPPNVSGHLQQMAAILRWRLHGKPAAIQAPTLVIHGENDRLVLPGNAKILADMIPGARLVMFEQASHIFPTDQPEKTRIELMKFLEGES